MSAHEKVRILRKRGYQAYADQGRVMALVEWTESHRGGFAVESRYEPVGRLSDWP